MRKHRHKSRLFTMRDIARIIMSLSAEEAMLLPIQTRFVKDYILTNLWPAVITSFYPDAYTIGDALHEAFLYDFFQSVWSEQWINVTFDILQRLGIDEEVLAQVRDMLIEQIRELFKVVLNF